MSVDQVIVLVKIRQKRVRCWDLIFQRPVRRVSVDPFGGWIVLSRLVLWIQGNQGSGSKENGLLRQTVEMFRVIVDGRDWRRQTGLLEWLAGFRVGFLERENTGEYTADNVLTMRLSARLVTTCSSTIQRRLKIRLGFLY